MKDRFTVFLDYGGVYAFDYNPNDWFEALGDSSTVIDARSVDASELDNLLCTDHISFTAYCRRLERRLGVGRIDVRKFRSRLLEATPLPHQAMVSLVDRLGTYGVNVALISDVARFEAEYIDRAGGYASLDHVYLSCRLGLSKRSTDMFVMAMDHAGVDGANVLFVDDRRYCLQTARRSGIRQLLDASEFRSAETLAKEIEKRIAWLRPPKPRRPIHQ